MTIKTINGMVPLDADVLMIGINPEHFDHFQRMVKGGFQTMNMGWSYVANLGKTFEYVVNDFLPKRPDLDVIYITDQVGRSRNALRNGALMLVDSIGNQQYDIRPYIVLDSKTEFLKPIFDDANIVAEVSNIEVMASERHREKCRLADAEEAA